MFSHQTEHLTGINLLEMESVDRAYWRRMMLDFWRNWMSFFNLWQGFEVFLQPTLKAYKFAFPWRTSSVDTLISSFQSSMSDVTLGPTWICFSLFFIIARMYCSFWFNDGGEAVGVIIIYSSPNRRILPPVLSCANCLPITSSLLRCQWRLVSGN